jgi:hypothetical protein
MALVDLFALLLPAVEMSDPADGAKSQHFTQKISVIVKNILQFRRAPPLYRQPL